MPAPRAVAKPQDAAPHPSQRWIWLRNMPLLIRVCIGALLGLVLVAVFAPLVTWVDPARQELLMRLQAPAGFGGAWARPLGTDQLGRDVFTRVLYGARVSLGIGLIGMTIGLLAGMTIGTLAGFFGGLLDELLMFLVDVQHALPFIIVALVGISLFGTSLTVLVLVVGLAGWEGYARLGRGMILGAREQPYVEAARALGATRGRLIARHILPNIIAPIIVLATYQLTGIIMLEATLSFLGLGVQPPTSSWGSMIGEGRVHLNTAWWVAVAPGVAIILTTMSISLVGDWLRDVLDPTLRGR
jgi:peptide/nickel transport system permease protein